MRKEMLLVPLSLILALGAAEGLLRGFPALMPLEVQIALEDRPGTHFVHHGYIGDLQRPTEPSTFAPAISRSPIRSMPTGSTTLILGQPKRTSWRLVIC